MAVLIRAPGSPKPVLAFPDEDKVVSVVTYKCSRPPTGPNSSSKDSSQTTQVVSSPPFETTLVFSPAVTVHQNTLGTGLS